MATLLEWCADLPQWVRDALRRVATTVELGDQDRQEIDNRIRDACGIAVAGDHPCVPIDEDHLPAPAGDDEPTVLCSLGPLAHVDRLANDQQLRFAIDGITLIYGDNGTGKSGYARVAKKLCQSRVVEEVRGNVFAEAEEPPAIARVRFRRPNAEIEEVDWRNGAPPLEALSRTYVLDSANAQAYIAKQSEIFYLPREISIAMALGNLYGVLARAYQGAIDPIEAAHRAAYGAAYAPTTAAGRIVRFLLLQTPSAALPSEADLRAAGTWNEALEAELAALQLKLASDPKKEAQGLRRAEASLIAYAGALEELTRLVGAEASDNAKKLLAEAKGKAAAAKLAAEKDFSEEPVPTTGEGPWKLMYQHARAFAASSGLREADKDFQEGDPCPTCQVPLSAEAAGRLKRFDEFISARAAEEAAEAEQKIAVLSNSLQAHAIEAPDVVARSLAEFAAMGNPAAELAEAVGVAMAAFDARRTSIVIGLQAGELPALGDVPEKLSEHLTNASQEIASQAEKLEKHPEPDPADLSRLAELNDAKRLSQELDAAIARRNDLAMRHGLQRCKQAVDTAPVSRFTTQRRRELVTPELERLIDDEIAALDLAHIPLKVSENTERGKSFFDVALQTRQNATKARVLSEGEQTALGLACFLAEVGRLPGNHGIIVDDPVSSLDHVRLRKVAERLVKEAARGRQLIIFTHNLVFFQEIVAAAAATNPQVPLLTNVVSRAAGRFGVITESEEPWIARKVNSRIEALTARLAAVPDNADMGTDAYRRLCKDFYTDLRETWERLVEELLLGGVVTRYGPEVKTMSLKGVMVDDDDYRTVFAAMKRVSERSGHDMAAGRQIPVADKAEMRRDLDALSNYRTQINRRKRDLEEARKALEAPPEGKVA